MPKTTPDTPADYDDQPEPESAPRRRAPLWLRLTGSILGFGLLLVGSFELVYAGKVYPGVTADGVYLGGLTRSAAIARLDDQTKNFTIYPLTITQGTTNLRIPVTSLGLTYDTTRATDLALQYGHQGSFWEQAKAQARALFGRATNFADYHYNDDRLTPYLVQLTDDVTTPVENAALNFNDNQAEVTTAKPGARLDIGRLTRLINDRLSQTSTEPIAAPVYDLAPDLATGSLEHATSQLTTYLAGPITLSYSGVERQIDQKTIISWIQVGTHQPGDFLQTRKLEDLYAAPPSANLTLSHPAVAAYVADLAKGTDQTAQNAVLTMQDDALTVTQPSHNGVKLDQAAAVTDILAALTKTTGRDVTLNLTTTRADVNEDNLASLGIKELISEGETYFPGSPSTRLTNVRSGASKFNGVLLKPGETFSFGALLGDVGPETGYVPELVILGDHEEKQYGGGLCQVSSTAFRAALQAGLPILQRVNHAFAISYYTWPYSVPGLDATIYYPQVDFKFKNDTGSYILIQTAMKGYDLKFDFFGTKTKSGVIRGPEFVTGSSDATQPSHTIFYRDILDLSGNVTKTDKFDTYYKSSKDFPITKQFN